ncbi:MAG TPA: hypothetical protein PKD99_02460 [Sphingopyxis sp.]|nr:hypothetical protein [Sphingopyxis sp.]HMP43940.1 hypothetical protein [Sphingopyxis sp.]HMQ20023.1 hypothetical protein [Sphingopyxis sp.]
MSGLCKEHFIPADPPPVGRYVVWRRDKPAWDWDVACMTDGGKWWYPDGAGEMHDVIWFMDVGGEA